MRKILIIEDDASLIEGLTLIFKEEGYGVLTESSGKNVTADFIATTRPSAILLDYLLPDENGMQVALRLKQHNDSKHIPIVMMSATKSIMEKALRESGIDYFLAKPFDIDQLLVLIRQCTSNFS